MNKIILFFIIICFLILLPVEIRGQEEIGNTGIDLNINAGFSHGYENNDWLPLYIKIENKGVDFAGEIEIVLENKNIFRQDESIDKRKYKIPLNISNNSTIIKRKVIYYVSGYHSPIKLRLIQDNKTVKEKKIELQEIVLEYPGTLKITDIRPTADNLDDTSQRFQKILYFNPEFLPEDWAGYSGINSIIIDNINLNQLNRLQIDALRKWFIRGNNFILEQGEYLDSNLNLLTQILPENQFEINYIQFEDYDFIGEQAAVISSRNGLTASDLLQNNPVIDKPGILDEYVDELYSSVEYWLPGPLRLIIIIFVFIILFYYLFNIKQKFELNSLYYIIFLTLFTAIFGIYIHFSFGNDLIRKNQLIQEIAVIDKLPSSNIGTVESYITFLNRKETENIGFSLERQYGVLTDFSPYNNYQLNRASHIKFHANKVKAEFEDIKNWSSGGFRTQYLASIPIIMETSKDGNTYQLEVNNLSSYSLEKMYILFKDSWFAVDEDFENISLDREKAQSSRPWRPGIRNIEQEILDKIVYNKLNINDSDNYIISISVIKGEPPAEGIKTDQNWGHQLKGFLIIPIKI